MGVAVLRKLIYSVDLEILQSAELSFEKIGSY